MNHANGKADRIGVAKVSFSLEIEHSEIYVQVVTSRKGEAGSFVIWQLNENENENEMKTTHSQNRKT